MPSFSWRFFSRVDGRPEPKPMKSLVASLLSIASTWACSLPTCWRAQRRKFLRAGRPARLSTPGRRLCRAACCPLSRSVSRETGAKGSGGLVKFADVVLIGTHLLLEILSVGLCTESQADVLVGVRAAMLRGIPQSECAKIASRGNSETPGSIFHRVMRPCHHQKVAGLKPVRLIWLHPDAIATPE